MPDKQKGFTLVELMVAMAIGTVIILGAGQLFLTTFQTFKKVDELSRKQESLIFIAQRVASEIRQQGPGRYTLRCELDGDNCNCTVADQNENGQPLVSFYKDLSDDNLPNQCAEEEHALGEPTENDSLLYRVELPLENNGQAIVYHVTHRAALFNANDNEQNGTNTPDPNNPGYYMNGDQIYNDRCYVPGNGNLNTNRNGCNAP